MCRALITQNFKHKNSSPPKFVTQDTSSAIWRYGGREVWRYGDIRIKQLLSEQETLHLSLRLTPFLLPLLHLTTDPQETNPFQSFLLKVRV
jgi:hypothetical protein